MRDMTICERQTTRMKDEAKVDSLIKLSISLESGDWM